MQLYHFEGLYAELFTELTQYPFLTNFKNYEEDLQQWDPKRTLMLYTELLKQEMDKACDRKQYRHILWHLQGLNAYPGGREAAQELPAYWHTYHKNRPAMKDELQKAGYPQK